MKLCVIQMTYYATLMTFNETDGIQWHSRDILCHSDDILCHFDDLQWYPGGTE